MKLRMTVLLVAIAVVTLGLYGTSFAFHDGGVARCEGCHTMHNSLGGAALKTTGGVTAVGQAGPYLLQGLDASSACLNCHGTGSTTSSYHVSTENVTPGGGNLPQQYTPGGDFSWIKYTDNAVGQTRGHNIVATAFSYLPETRFTTNKSPGGDYPVNALGCSGCHDPHGKTRTDSTGTVSTSGAPIEGSGSYGATPTVGLAVGAYRLLGGNGYSPKAAAGAVTFGNNPPIAVAPSSYNRLETTGNQTRVAYGQGMSEWCSNCHGAMHKPSGNNGVGGLVHPTGNGAALGALASNYNSYVSSGNMTGQQTTSYNSLVPYEEHTASITDLALLAGPNGTSAGTINPGQVASTAGPANGGSANVMCLSCHRAHATGFASMTRFDVSDALVTDGAGAFEPRNGMTDAALTAAYYGRIASDFGKAQRVLCNKCHAKD